MESPHQDFRAKATPADNGTEPRHFARRIDCAPAPAPRRRDPVQAPSAHGYGRAPGEDI
jgi:hypothetical protein